MRHLKFCESNEGDFEDICYSIENMFITHIADKYDIRAKDYSFHRHVGEKNSVHHDFRQNFVILKWMIDADRIIQENDSDITMKKLMNQYITDIEDFHPISGTVVVAPYIKKEFKDTLISFMKRVESHYQTIESDDERFAKRSLTTYMNSFKRNMTQDDFTKWLRSYSSIESKIPKKYEKMQSNIRLCFTQSRALFGEPIPPVVCNIEIKFYWK